MPNPDAETQQLLALAQQRGITVDTPQADLETDALLAEAQRRGLQVPEPAGTATNIARQLGQGLTFGFADEAEAALRAPFSERTRPEIQEEIRAQNRMYEQENPALSFGLQLGGGLATGGLGASRVAGLKAVQATPKLLRYATGGAASGATAGAGYAEEDRLGSAVTGGTLGGVSGLALPAMIGMIGKMGRPAAQAIMDRMGRNPGQVAQRKILEALDRDQLSPEDAIAKLRALGPEGTLADVSPNVSGLAETLAQRPGRALDTATDVFEQRRAGQVNRILDEIDEKVGGPRTAAMTGGGGSWDAALAQDIPLDESLINFMRRPSMKGAWRKAQILAAEQDPTQPLPSHAQLMQAFKDEELAGISTQVMHWLKKGLDDVLEGKRDPISGKLPTGRNDVRAIQATRAEFRDLVTDRNPAYGQLLDETAGLKRLEDAHEKGTKFARLTSPSQVKTQLDSFKNAGEKTEYRRGMRDAIENMVANDAERGYDTTRKVLGQANKIRVAFGKKEGDEIIDFVKRERAMAQAENRILGNSRTAFRQATAADAGVEEAGSLSQFGRDLAWGGNPILAAASAGLRQLQRRLRGGISEPVAERMTPMLFHQGAAGQRALQEILAARGALPGAPIPLGPAAMSALAAQQGRAGSR